MKTVNFIGLRETAGIIYMKFDRPADGIATVEEFLDRINTLFQYDNQLTVNWHDMKLKIHFFLYR